MPVQGDQSITRDIVTIARRIRLLGFNAIRLPFSMADLFTTQPRNFNGTCNTTPDTTLLAATTPPNVTTPGAPSSCHRNAGCLTEDCTHLKTSCAFLDLQLLACTWATSQLTRQATATSTCPTTPSTTASCSSSTSSPAMVRASPLCRPGGVSSIEDLTASPLSHSRHPCNVSAPSGTLPGSRLGTNACASAKNLRSTSARGVPSLPTKFEMQHLQAGTC